MKRKILQKEFNYAADGSVLLDMVVKDDSNFLSPFSNDATPIISEDVSSFIDNSIKSVHHKQSFTLRVHSDCIDGQEQELYTKGIKKYYSDRSVSVKRELRRNIWIAVILALIGMITLAVANGVEFRFDSVVWAETIDIVAWVLLWESVDITAFKMRSLRLDYYRYSALCSMPIEFLPLN